MTPKQKLKLIKEVGEEIITEEELLELLKTKKHPIAYDGFEPSGRIHIAQGLLRAINVNKIIKTGVKFKFWVADWFALMNNKLGGDLEKIKTTGKYFIEVWKACGMDTKNVEFLWASDVMNDTDYWLKVLTIARLNSVARITRCAQIMGRSEKDTLSAAQIFYPCMQCADIFHLKADITQLGMDQRKVNVLAREVAPKLGFKKPIVVSHHMLLGLGKPPETGLQGAERSIELKMSKSKPDTAIFMTDSEEEIKRKFNKAYCPEKQVGDNPVLEYCKYIVFEKFPKFKIERPKKFGGNIEFKSYQELEKSFVAGKLHPADLKDAAAKYINKLLVPVREYFKKNKKAKKLKELVESYKVTK
jgi:tyrosyl-tRNA synthetase